MATLTASALSIPYSFTAGTSADASQVNSNFTDTQTQVNNLVTDTQTLNTATSQLSSNNTYTGTNTFRHIYFTSTYGIGDSFILLDSDNAGAEADQSIRFNRGSTSATPARFTYDSTNHLYRFSTDADSTLAIIRHADGAASTDGATYGQVGKLATTNTWALVNTYTVYPVIASYTAPTSDTQFAPKKYVDDQTASLVTGGIIQQASAPAVTSGNLWIDTTTVANLKLLRADGSVFAPVTGIHQGTSAPTSPTPLTGHLWIDTTSTDSPSLKRYNGSAWKQVIPATIDAATTFTSAVTMSASTIFSAGFSVASSQTIDFNSNRLQEVGTPTASTDGANKSYVDGRSPKIFSTTASKSVTNQASPVTFVATGDGSITIAANTLEVGDILVWETVGYVTTGGAASAFTITPYLRGQSFGSAGCTPANNLTSSPFKFTYTATIRTIGSSGTIIGQGKLEWLNTTSPPAAWISAATAVATGTTTINTTLDSDIDTYVSVSTADSTWVATNTNFYVYK